MSVVLHKIRREDLDLTPHNALGAVLPWTRDQHDTSPKGDGKLRCFRCRGRFAPHLMHRVMFDRIQAEPARVKRDRDTKPVWLCPGCWHRKFSVSAEKGGAS